MHVTKPTFRWEWNINTIAVIVGFIVMAVGWGMNYQQLQSGRETNAANITRIEARLDQLEGTQRTLENHELRLTNAEAQLRDTSSAMRAIETSISSLSSDLRLTREILERLERSINGSASQAAR